MKKNLLLLLPLAFLLGCKSYEESPGTTLRGVEDRIAGVWTEKENTLTDGNGSTLNFEQMQFIQSTRAIRSVNPSEKVGQWDLDDSKDHLEIFLFVGNGLDLRFKILALTNKFVKLELAPTEDYDLQEWSGIVSFDMHN